MLVIAVPCVAPSLARGEAGVFRVFFTRLELIVCVELFNNRVCNAARGRKF